MWLIKKEEPLCPCCRREFLLESTLNDDSDNNASNNDGGNGDGNNVDGENTANAHTDGNNDVG